MSGWCNCRTRWGRVLSTGRSVRVPEAARRYLRLTRKLRGAAGPDRTRAGRGEMKEEGRALSPHLFQRHLLHLGSILHHHHHHPSQSHQLKRDNSAPLLCPFPRNASLDGSATRNSKLTSADAEKVDVSVAATILLLEKRQRANLSARRAVFATCRPAAKTWESDFGATHFRSAPAESIVQPPGEKRRSWWDASPLTTLS